MRGILALNSAAILRCNWIVSAIQKNKGPKKKEGGSLMETDAAVDKISELQFLSTAAWKSLLAFHTVSTGTAAMNLKQQNRTDHLLQKPDISICY